MFLVEFIGNSCNIFWFLYGMDTFLVLPTLSNYSPSLPLFSIKNDLSLWRLLSPYSFTAFFASSLVDKAWVRWWSSLTKAKNKIAEMRSKPSFCKDYVLFNKKQSGYASTATVACQEKKTLLHFLCIFFSQSYRRNHTWIKTSSYLYLLRLVSRVTRHFEFYYLPSFLNIPSKNKSYISKHSVRTNKMQF